MGSATMGRIRMMGSSSIILRRSARAAAGSVGVFFNRVPRFSVPVVYADRVLCPSFIYNLIL